MLSRATQRRIRRNVTLQHSFEQLQFPWLAPAQLQQQRSVTIARRSSATAIPRVGAEIRSNASTSRSTSVSKLANAGDKRTLATEAFVNRASLNYADIIPFVGQDASRHRNSLSYNSQQQQQQPLDRQPTYFLELPDPSNPLILRKQSSVPSGRLMYGIGGDPIELHQNLAVSTRVGRLDRAEIIIRRLQQIYHPSAQEMSDAHNIYMAAALEKALEKGSVQELRYAERWLQTEMRMKGVKLDWRTLHPLIKACINLLFSKQRDRALRHYLAIAEESGEVTWDTVTDPARYTSREHKALDRVLPTWAKELGSAEINPETDSFLPLTTPLAALGEAEPVPPVRPAKQKGLGLKTLRSSLARLNEAQDPLSFSTEVDEEAASQRQRQLEQDVVSAALARWKEEHAKLDQMGVVNSKAAPLSALLYRWHNSLSAALKEEFAAISESLAKEVKNPGDDRLTYGPFLESVSIEKLSALTIIYVLGDLTANGMTSGSRLPNLTKGLGTQVQIESEMTRRMSSSYAKTASSKVRLQRRMSAMQRRLSRRGVLPSQVSDVSSDSVEASQQKWSGPILAKVGAVLLSKLVATAKISVTKQHPKTGETITQLQPAFHHSYRYERGVKVGKIAANEALGTRLRREPPSSILGKRLPMIAPPEPWTDYAEGGFLEHPSTVIREKSCDKEQRSYVRTAAKRGDLDSLFEGLNVLGRTPWKVNPDVFKVQLEAWNRGEAVGNLAPADPRVEIPPEPKTADWKERNLWKERVRQLENEVCGYHSLRCFQNYQMEVARAFRNETIYFPHSIDFRGRAYPEPPYLNHMGADNARALLVFADGKPLGEHGLAWLKVHLANLFGFDKASFAERQQFTMDHLDDIRDSAANPLDGQRWWLKGEDPWQLLGACFELTAALDQPDPTQFISHLPVHQDGTCNGLQHYAALGGDVVGARQVNLEPGDRPADIYRAVADVVQAAVAEDAANGVPAAKILDGKITRKVVKQTVMTNVYGVTYIGARQQVRKQLEAIFPNFEQTPEMHIGTLAAYVAIHIFKALGSMFNGARSIQQWLGVCAERISRSVTSEQIQRYRGKLEGSEVGHADGKYRTYRSPMQKYYQKGKRDGGNPTEAIKELNFMTSVIWTTPLKLPVVQPYRTTASKQIRTALQLVSLIEPSSDDPVSRRKQLQGFPPNFIHSLDATHMLLSALACDNAGLTFASVHDSFWTHACDVDRMNGLLRDSFVRMHSEDIVGRLAAEFTARYGTSMYRRPFAAKSVVGRKIAAWRKRQPRSDRAKVPRQFSELALESDRLTLLRSKNSIDRAKGLAMVTPASIFEAHRDDPSALTAESVLLDPLGSVTEKTTDEEPTSDSMVTAAEETLAPVLEADPVVAEGPEGPKAGAEAVLAEAAGIAATTTVETAEAVEATPKPKKARQSSAATFSVWLPLTFPPVPQKGEFDVQRLRESAYFFS